MNAKITYYTYSSFGLAVLNMRLNSKKCFKRAVLCSKPNSYIMPYTNKAVIKNIESLQVVKSREIAKN